ncbi:MAG: SPOR domain-containing protein [Armatimonadetes bacterium]|nr:SPOR domain-containing protein [Armatimonadota bacterium]MDW8122363.1 SPOR domain-containing protein [Armatimonadota bacterium]
MSEDYLKAGIAFVGGILIVLVSFYVGKQVIGPILSPRPEPVAEGIPAEEVLKTTPRPVPNAIYRKDTDGVPKETVVSVEPIPRPTPPEGPPEESPTEEVSPTQPPARPPRPAVVGSVPAERPTPPQPPERRPLSPPEPTTESPPVTERAVTPPPPPPPPSVQEKRFWVRVGVYSSSANAERAQELLVQKNLESFVKEDAGPSGSRFKVYVGAFSNRAEAESVIKELAQKGIEAVVEEVTSE